MEPRPLGTLLNNLGVNEVMNELNFMTFSWFTSYIICSRLRLRFKKLLLPLFLEESNRKRTN